MYTPLSENYRDAITYEPIGTQITTFFGALVFSTIYDLRAVRSRFSDRFDKNLALGGSFSIYGSPCRAERSKLTELFHTSMETTFSSTILFRRRTFVVVCAPIRSYASSLHKLLPGSKYRYTCRSCFICKCKTKRELISALVNYRTVRERRKRKPWFANRRSMITNY